MVVVSGGQRVFDRDYSYLWQAGRRKKPGDGSQSRVLKSFAVFGIMGVMWELGSEV
jgi:hypothetical protein